MKSIVEAVFARMPGSVCKRDALLKWCVERLVNYVSDGFFDGWKRMDCLGNINNEFFQFLDGWNCILLFVTFISTRSD
jgi:hypothetical protein